MHPTIIRKIFVCEFITAGGFVHDKLPSSLAKEGALMRDALLRDLSSLPYVINTTIDYRLPHPKTCAKVVVINSEDNEWDVWSKEIALVDAVWLVAPETNGLLSKLTELAQQANKIILGCSLEAVQISSSKVNTCEALDKAGIKTTPCYSLINWPKMQNIPWLAKPDDGAGCDNTVVFDSASQLSKWLELRDATTFIIQPYMEGVSASISCIMFRGNAYVLSCNKQIIEVQNNALYYQGSILNGMAEKWSIFDQLANQIAQALPILNGYIGLDVIVNGNDVTVVEINPRLTTSYAVLAEACGVNPAELVINTLTSFELNRPKLIRKQMEIYVS